MNFASYVRMHHRAEPGVSQNDCEPLAREFCHGGKCLIGPCERLKGDRGKP